MILFQMKLFYINVTLHYLKVLLFVYRSFIWFFHLDVLVTQFWVLTATLNKRHSTLFFSKPSRSSFHGNNSWHLRTWLTGWATHSRSLTRSREIRERSSFLLKYLIVCPSLPYSFVIVFFFLNYILKTNLHYCWKLCILDAKSQN